MAEVINAALPHPNQYKLIHLGILDKKDTKYRDLFQEVDKMKIMSKVDETSPLWNALEHVVWNGKPTVFGHKVCHVNSIIQRITNSIFLKNKFLNPVMIIGTIGDFLIKIKEVYCVVSSLNFITIKGY